jgi:hypothetical protein
MEDIVPLKIQILSILGSLLFLAFIARLILKGKLREEYSVIWIACTAFLLFFSIWRDGLEKIAGLLGVYYAPSLIFLFGFFAIILFLVHLSMVASRQHRQLKELAQELALLKGQKEADKKSHEEEP